MKKIFFILAISFVFLGNALIVSGSDFGLVVLNGKVNLREIGGQGLFVFSLWQGNTKSLVDSTGQFSVQALFSSRLQKLAVHDRQGMTRALALVFVQDGLPIVFDARSTALAVLFGEPGLVKDTGGMDQLARLAETKKTFQSFVAFLQKKLPNLSLEVLTRDADYVALFESCNREIFREDRSAINKSLFEAQEILEKLLQ